MSVERIKVGDKVPAGINFRQIDPEKGTAALIASEEFFAGKRVALFGVPGAFTPGCSKTHCPSFVLGHSKLKAAGFDAIACTSVNDAFVMDAWCKSQNGEGKLEMLADGNGEFAAAIGLLKDYSQSGMGPRSMRYGALVEDGVVKYLGVDETRGVIEVSTAEAILASME